MLFKEKATNEIKQVVRKPLGNLLSGEQLIRVIKRKISKNKKLKVIAVGDETGHFLSINNIPLYIWIYDGKIMRKKVDFNLPFPSHVVKNPRSHITHELQQAIDDALKSRKESRIFIIGEEDLATLYLIYKAENALIVYGQPNEGEVLVETNKKMKKKAFLLLSKFR